MRANEKSQSDPVAPTAVRDPPLFDANLTTDTVIADAL